MLSSKDLKTKLGISTQRTLRKYAIALNISPSWGGYRNSQQFYEDNEVEKIQELHDYLQTPGHTIREFLIQKENEELKLKLFLSSVGDAKSNSIEQVEAEILLLV